MANTRSTFGSLLGTVEKTATTVINVLDAANGGVSMLNAYVSKAANEQRMRHIADAEVFKENLIREVTQEEANSTLKVIKFCAQSPEHKQAYETSYEKFSNLFKTQEQ